VAVLLVRLSFFVVALIGLTGCISSQAELITPEVAATPIADGTRFSAFDLEKREKEPGTVVIRKIGTDYVILETKEGASVAVMRFRLAEIEPNVFIAMGKLSVMMMEETPADLGWGYGLVTREGDSYTHALPSCLDLQKATEAAGKTPADFGALDDECAFGSLEDIKGVMFFMRDAGMKPKISLDPVR
jgi:hypothetical protein